MLLLKKTYKHFLIKQTFIIILSYATSALLSAYYWLPAFLEGKYTWTTQNGHTGFIEPIQNYIFSPVGHGFLFQGNNGEYRLIIGYPHLIVIVILIYLLFAKKKIFKIYEKKYVIFLLGMFLIYFFLMTIYAKPFWNYFTFLNFFLMVWRLLVVIGFITAIIAGIIVTKIKDIKIIIIICFITIVSTMLNWGNREMVRYNPNDYYIHTDEYTQYIVRGDPFYENLYKHRILAAELVSSKYRRKSPIETSNT